MQSTLRPTTDSTGERGAIHRASYLIDRFSVQYTSGGGWACKCADFIAGESCRHTREAAGRRAAQAQITRHIESGSSLQKRGLGPSTDPTSRQPLSARQLIR